MDGIKYYTEKKDWEVDEMEIKEKKKKNLLDDFEIFQ